MTNLRILAEKSLARSVILDSGRLRFRASGSSMLPVIRPGDILVVHRRELHEVRQGEIAFFFCYDRMAVHRVVLKSPALLITQGDTHFSPDPPVTAENLLGVVVFIDRNGKVFAPAPRPSFVSRWTAAVLRRSDFAVSVWLRVYSLLSPTQLKILASGSTAVR